jgi:hypothetical protein
MGSYPPQGSGLTKITLSDQIDPGVILTSDINGSEFNVTNKLLKLDGSADVPLLQIPDTLTGKDADTLDGSHAGNEASKIPILDSEAFLGALNHYPMAERYSNHLGAVDNFTEVATNGNGTATEDAANHEIDLEGGITVQGYGLFQTKKTWTLSAKPIIVNFIVNNIVAGVGSNKSYAGLRSNFTNSSNVVAGCGFMVDTDGDVFFYCASGSVWNNNSITVNNGDLLTLVATSSSIRFYKNGVFQAERVAPYIPGSALHAGAGSLTYAIGSTTSGGISLDLLEITRYM